MLLPRSKTGTGIESLGLTSLPNGHGHPTSDLINMFRQATALDHEYLFTEDRHRVAPNPGPAARTASPAEVQSVSMEVSPGDVYRCRENLVTREIVGETIIVPISRELADLQKAFSLNATGGFIWERLDGSTSLETIHQAVTEHFKINKKDAWADLVELITDLTRADLIEKAQ
jgi:hypothetical protein